VPHGGRSRRAPGASLRARPGRARDRTHVGTGDGRAEWDDIVRCALARLPSESREAFLLKHVEELEYEDMARLTGAGVSALKMRVKRAREQLQAMLKEAERV